MKTVFLLVVSCLCACTSVTVRRPDPNLSIKHVCIEENAKVWVSDFLPVLRDGFNRHGIRTNVYSGTKPGDCDSVLTYTALQSWDIVPYLSHAELWLTKDGRQIGYAEFHLIGKGGFSLMKWQGTKTKMDPVIDELLQHRGDIILDKQLDRDKELPIIADTKSTTVERLASKSRRETAAVAESTPLMKKFFADLDLYDGPIVGTNQITRAEFVESSSGSGTVRLIAPGNNIFSGAFRSEPTSDQTLTVLSSKTRNTVKMLNDGNTGVLTATDDYGTRLECIYGTLAATGRWGGVCEDTRGNKYKLFFD
jgi:hypothetical protein